MRLTTLPLALLALCALTHPWRASAILDQELTFTALGAAKATKQWALTMETGHKTDLEAWNPVNCPSAVLGACTAQTPALMQKVGDLLRLNYTLSTPTGTAGSLTTFQGEAPTRIEGRLCYSMFSSTNRAWRKKNKPYPRLSVNCPRKIGKVEFVDGVSPLNLAGNSGSFVLDFDGEDEVPTSTWFAMIWVFCGDSVCAFETTENLNHVETIVEMGVTPGMKVAAIILSVVGPAFFIIFYALDQMYYRKHGRPIRLF